MTERIAVPTAPSEEQVANALSEINWVCLDEGEHDPASCFQSFSRALSILFVGILDPSLICSAHKGPHCE